MIQLHKDLLKIRSLGDGARKWTLLQAASGPSDTMRPQRPVDCQAWVLALGTPRGAGTLKEHSGGLAPRPAYFHPQVCGFPTRLAACSHRMTFTAQVK